MEIGKKMETCLENGRKWRWRGGRRYRWEVEGDGDVKGDGDGGRRWRWGGDRDFE
jgi:hypothetical protein